MMYGHSTEVKIPIGTEGYCVKVPNLIGIADPSYVPGVPDKRIEIARAMEHPIGTPHLRELAPRAQKTR